MMRVPLFSVGFILAFSIQAKAALSEFLTENDLIYNSDYAFVGEAPDDSFGCSVASAGDVDGDGLSDLIVGAYGRSTFMTNRGSAYIFLGSSLTNTVRTRYGVPAEYSAATANYTFLGSRTNDCAGFSVASAGDVDGDGLSDVLIGAYGVDTPKQDAGHTYLFLGSTLRSATSDVPILLHNADYFIMGEDGTNYCGYSVASAGDVDGDGKSDLIIGAPYKKNSSGNQAGMTYLLMGSNVTASAYKGIHLVGANYKIEGISSRGVGSMAGYCVASAGDVDGDGKSDILIGAPYANDTTSYGGKTYLFWGSSLLTNFTHLNVTNANITLYSTNAYSFTGTSVASAGDVDGDGKSDILIGAPYLTGSGTGKTFLVLSSTLAATPTNLIDLDQSDYVLEGEQYGDQAGISVASAGDIDNDGYADILIGASEYESSRYEGKTYLLTASNILSGSASISLSTATHSFLGYKSERSGNAVTSPGDLDGDSLPDLVIGASIADSYRGKIYIVSSQDTEDESFPCFEGSDSYACDEGYDANTNVYSTMTNHYYESSLESDHFSFFLDAGDADIASITEDKWTLMQDALECGYRYYICKLGMSSPISSNKIQVYIGDDGTKTGGSSRFIMIDSSYLTTDRLLGNCYYSFQHELFHLIQKKYFYNSYDNFSEGTAVLAEQMISDETMFASLNGSDVRAYALDNPDFFNPYHINVFWRYLFEQLYGVDCLTNPSGAPEGYLAEFMTELGTNSSSATITDVTRSYVSLEGKHYSTTTNYSDMLDNYITMQYAFRYVTPTSQPKYALAYSDEFDYATEMTFSSSNAIINKGSYFPFKNTNTVYATGAGTGFVYFLNGEYHKLKIASTVSNLWFGKSSLTADTNILYQFITRDSNNVVDVYYPLRTNNTETIALRTDPTNLAESVLVAYTTIYSPYSTGTGRVYHVVVGSPP